MPIPVAFDTETWLIEPGLLAPPMVCLTSTTATGSRLLHANVERMPRGPIVRIPATAAAAALEGPNDSARAHFEWILEQDPIYGLNVAYDMAVCMALWPDLAWKIFKAYAEGRVVDIGLSQRLIDNSKGRMKYYQNLDPSGYSLEGLSARHLKKKREGKHEDDAWRLRYRELDPVPLPHWPKPAVDYAIEDSDDTFDVAEIQWNEHRELIGDSPAQARAAFALQLQMCWGTMTDPAKVQRLKEVSEEMYWQLSHELAKQPPCIEHEDPDCKICGPRQPLVRAPGRDPYTGKKVPAKQEWTRNVRAAQRRMLDLETHNATSKIEVDVPATFSVKLTDTGYEKLKERTEGVPGLSFFDVFSLEEMIKYTSVDEDACKESGDHTLQQYTVRTQLHGIVNTHVPDLLKGTVTPIQPRYNTFVESGRTSCSKGKPKKKTDKPPPTNGFQMQNPKKALKGFPAGVGIRECFVARPGYLYADNDFSGLELHTGAEACHAMVGYSLLGEALNAGRDPHLQFGAKLMGISYEEAKARKHEPEVRRFRGYAKPANFGLPGGLGIRGLIGFAAGYGVKLTFDEAKKLRDDWFDEFPEWRDYFREIRAHIDKVSGTGVIKQVGVNRVRGGVTYTSACNTLFQGLGADGSKHACFEVAYRCYVPQMNSPLYGARPCAFIHDEILAEVIERYAHEQAVEMAQVMVDACNEFLPNYPVRCEPALCKHWTKEVEAVYSEEGRLQPYDLAKAGKWRVFYDEEATELVDWKEAA